MPNYAHPGSVVRQTAPGQAIRAERLSLQTQIAALEEQLDYRNSETEIRINNTELPFASAPDLASRLSQLAERYEILETLEVAATRLERVARRDQAIAAILEIVAALVGSEEVALYEITGEAGAELLLSACAGVLPPSRIALGAGRIGQIARSGQEYLATTPVLHPGEATEDRISVCMPLLRDGAAAWILVIYGMLPQKQFFEKRDVEILRLLGSHAATALGQRTE